MRISDVRPGIPSPVGMEKWFVTAPETSFQEQSVGRVAGPGLSAVQSKRSLPYRDQRKFPENENGPLPRLRPRGEESDCKLRANYSSERLTHNAKQL